MQTTDAAKHPNSDRWTAQMFCWKHIATSGSARNEHEPLTYLLQAIKNNCSAGKPSDLEAGKPSPDAYPRLLIDGPYGAPAQDFYKFRVVLLIGAGIGLTPFASVMRECHHQMDRNARQVGCGSLLRG
jgi:hypothetical protein